MTPVSKWIFEVKRGCFLRYNEEFLSLRSWCNNKHTSIILYTFRYLTDLYFKLSTKPAQHCRQQDPNAGNSCVAISNAEVSSCQRFHALPVIGVACQYLHLIGKYDFLLAFCGDLRSRWDTHVKQQNCNPQQEEENIVKYLHLQRLLLHHVTKNN